MKDNNIKTGVCLECKTEFNLKHKDQRFCGKSCTARYCNRLRPKQEKLVEKDICKSCGEEFTVGSKNPKYRKKFCNKSCAATYNNLERGSGEILKVVKKEKILTDCLHCKNPIYTRNKTFCSRECRLEFNITSREKDIIAGKGSYPVHLRSYLLKTREEKCEECGIGNEWNGKKLTLQMDHTDGCSDNNSLENLRLLCPNCHTQTPTYGSKNKGMISRRNKYLRDYLESRKS